MPKRVARLCAVWLLSLAVACGGDDAPAPMLEPDAGEPEPDSATPDPVCGDNRVGPSEGCDDGNTEDGDGCSAACEVETPPSGCVDGEPCCGNGELEDGERCDEGDFADGLGCNEDCSAVEDDYRCATAGQACTLCGDGSVGGDEVCDDGNTESGDGCVESCLAVESGFACPEDGGACALCGDGVVDASEECDDQNFQSGDGCSEACRIEAGATCLQAGVVCSVCGNGFIEFIAIDDNGTPDDPSDDFYDAEDPDALEGCDDGNLERDDGCSDGCNIEDGGELPWLCPLPGVGCGRCGDGEVQAIETCDDGVNDDGAPEGDDGCSSDCTTVETGYLCPPEGGACVVCGDGVLDEPLEACDDMNNLSGDGCNRKCELETDAAWLCPVPGAPCELCGNGVHEAHEGCDDGNTEDADGCPADCSAEDDDYNCYFEGFACAHCGDGALQPGESCDEGHLANEENKTAGCVDCARTDAWSCPGAGAPCELCGDGVIGDGDPSAAFETCDDDNTFAGDGCSPTCQVEPGYVCDEDSCTAAACGDGFAASGEECDDGNRSAGDGCSFLCRVEPDFACSGAAGCRRTRCGDGLVEGDEACDDGGALCDGGSADGLACVSIDEHAACIAGGGSCAAAGSDGCATDCTLETGFKCDNPGVPCALTSCGDGFVEGTEQCDVGGALCVAMGDALDGSACTTPEQFAACAAVDEGVSGCVALDANGCDTSCMLKPDFKCEEGASCEGLDRSSDCCTPTICGDGLVEGLEACDDGGNADEDGCSALCTVEDFYRCKNEPDMPSTCKPIMEYVSILRFRVTNVSPEALTYDPDRRSFGGHKSQGNTLSIEMCLDGTVIDQGDTTAGGNGTIFAPDGTTSELPVDCSDFILEHADDDPPTPLPVPCYDAPLRADVVAPLMTLRDGTFDPVTGHVLFTHDIEGPTGTLLVQLPRDIDQNASVDIRMFSVQLDFNAFGITVAEDGDLYAVDASTQVLRVLPRLRDLAGNVLPAPDCSDLTDPELDAGVNCTSFSETPDGTRERDAASDNPLDAIFTLPGESMVSVFNAYDGADEYEGIDLDDGTDVTSSNYFSVYDTESLDAPRTSALPGVLFGLGDEGTSYSNHATAAETAADGAAFIVCVSTGSEDCQLFARKCGEDADCPPGTLCNRQALSSTEYGYCNAPGEARDDVYEVERDVFKTCASSGAQNGLDCTSDASACEGEGGSCEPGRYDPQLLDVLVNDTLSESACVDPRFTILAVCGDGVEQAYEMIEGNECPEDSDPDVIGEVTFDEPNGEVEYDAPDDGSCGFFDTFEYTVDLGGNVIDTAQVRVAVNCVCGDGITDGNEQCDDGEFNGAPGTCVENCGDVSTDNDVLARCSDACLLNVLCGDGFAIAPEECDDGNTDSGDGCSAVCTRESECGNGTVELGEECDDGPSGSDACNPSCTLPVCGDGNRDADEQCDDGNTRVGDGCNASCMIEARCGDRIVQPGEDCDDGNTAPSDGCSATCQVENVCGNGDVEGAEVCDGADFGSCPMVDGAQIQCVNSVNGAPNICLCRNYCGDGKIGGTEECDEGASGADDCRGSDPDSGEPCTEIRCGDGVIDDGELCDDGNTNTADACSNACMPRTSCGNGTVEAPEECDDDNNVSGDGCTATCQDEAASCGDGVQDADEQCDDENTTSGDGCDANCRLEGAVCGDGNRDTGEECDDGNMMGGDGCSAQCRIEPQ